MKARAGAALILALLAAGMAALSRLPARGARIIPSQDFVEPEAITITTPTGGKIAQVLARKGDRVAEGQLLFRLDSSELDARLARAHSAFGAVPDHLLDSAVSFFERVPPQTVAHLLQSNPEKIAAEQEYSEALVDFERAPTPQSRARLERAARNRKLAYAHSGRISFASFDALRNLQGEGLATLRWLEAQRARFEIRAPAGGVIELLDLQPGDLVAPNSGLALLDPGRVPPTP